MEYIKGPPYYSGNGFYWWAMEIGDTPEPVSVSIWSGVIHISFIGTDCFLSLPLDRCGYFYGPVQPPQLHTLKANDDKPKAHPLANRLPMP